MNKLSSYKKNIYYAFLNALGDRAVVDLYIYHYDALIFKQIIEDNLGKYNYYAIMPHFYYNLDKANVNQLVEKIPIEDLIILDKDLPNLKGDYLSIHQDFQNDIYSAMESANDLLAKYSKLVLIFPKDSHYPMEIVKGFRFYCIHYNKEFAIINHACDDGLESNTAYVVLEEADLATLIKKIRQTELKIGSDVGIVSFNETSLKELLDITVITTDFEAMGKKAAELLLEKKRIKIKNPFYMIKRGSL